MKAKKVISMFLVGAAAIGLLAGCGSENGGSGAAVQQSTSETGTDSAGSRGTEADSGTGTADSSTENSSSAGTSSGDASGILVVYYSATGNTEEAANAIADAVGADLFELEPVEPYTEEDLNYGDENSRVSVEHENEDQRDVELVTTTVENWDSYDTVFIGYPIWWGIAAWPVDTFVENNDFTGKRVIPFATSASSGLGESGQLLAEMAGTGDWQEGMRFSSSVDETEVQEWVNGLGL